MSLPLLVLLGTFSIANAIINGTDAPAKAFPFMVSLQWDGKHKCGGTLLNNNTILTAGHCYPLIYVDPSQPQKASALMGTNDQTSSGGAAQRRTLGRAIFMDGVPDDWKTMARFTNPPDFEKSAPLDYLIFKLQGAPVEESEFIKYGKLSVEPGVAASVPRDGDSCTIIGWGRYKHPDVGPKRRNDFPAKLQQGVTKLSIRDCFRDGKQRPELLCVPELKVGGKYQGMVCFGDSGSPLQCERAGKSYIAGITEAAAIPCNRPDVPSKYLSIEYRIDWIKNNM